MTDLIRWNANFVRGLAQSVLDRAKVIRLSLEPAKRVAKKATKKVSSKAKSAGRRKAGKAKRSDA